MAAIIRVRDENGNVTDIPAIVGAKGDPGTSITVISVTESSEDGCSNIVTFSDGKTLTIKNGKKGSKGMDATPVTPLFANSIEECSDASKFYVLPDGYIYAYMEHTEEVVIPGETVTIPAKAALMHFKRYSLSSGAFKPVSSAFDCMVIPFDTSGTGTKTITFTGITRPTTYKNIYAGTENTAFTYEITSYTDSDNKASVTIDCSSIPGDYRYITLVINTLNENYSGIGIAVDGIPYEIAVTTDPSIATPASTTTAEDTTETVTIKGFANTGHAFVPADYEDRIVELEGKAEVIARNTVRIQELENKTENISTNGNAKSKRISIDSSEQALETSVSMTVPQLKKNKTIAFYGVYTGTLSEITIVQGEGSGLLECKCVVSETTITVLKNNANVYTAEHGLTFGNYFSIVLVTGNLNKTKIYLSSGGDSFSSGEFQWATSRRELTLHTNVPFVQYQLTFGSNDFNKEIWLYGDSYFDHWLPISISRGYTNCLADGYSGATSSSGLTSLRTAIKHGTPAKIVWCLGMNNGDNGAINQSWLDCITEVKEICEKNDVELWVSTIPNTPTVDNTYKNAYIRENFDHVIDLSRLVGAEDNTAWYTSLLSSDNVHPSTEGDFYIAGIMETYFPEMLDV